MSHHELTFSVLLSAAARTDSTTAYCLTRWCPANEPSQCFLRRLSHCWSPPQSPGRGNRQLLTLQGSAPTKKPSSWIHEIVSGFVVVREMHCQLSAREAANNIPTSRAGIWEPQRSKRASCPRQSTGSTCHIISANWLRASATPCPNGPISRPPKARLRSDNSEGAAQASFCPRRTDTVLTGHPFRYDQETKCTCPRIGKCAPSHRSIPPSFEVTWGVWGQPT